jgi:hypothetical protein
MGNLSKVLIQRELDIFYSCMLTPTPSPDCVSSGTIEASPHRVGDTVEGRPLQYRGRAALQRRVQPEQKTRASASVVAFCSWQIFLLGDA